MFPARTSWLLGLILSVGFPDGGFAEEFPAVIDVPAPTTGESAEPDPVPVPVPTDSADSTTTPNAAGEEGEPVLLAPPTENVDDETISVPAPDEGREVIIEEGGTLQEESVPETEPIWPRSLDFSQLRWRPGQGGMEWIPGHRDRFGMFSLTSESIHNWENWEGMATTTGSGFRFLNGPVSPSDMPARLFEFTWGLHWSGEMMPGLSASLSTKAGLYTDFEDSVRDGWRFPSHAVLFHDVNDAVQTVAGVKYFDRENLQALPVAGVILRPDDRFRLEAIFPEPRIAWQVNADETSEHWLSLSGQIGGGEWAIERADTDRADIVTYNDYSVAFGLHTYLLGHKESLFEIGYIFARDLEYRSGAGDFEPDNTFFLRWSNRN